MTKQKRPPAQTNSKVRSRSGNPAVRAGEAAPVVRSATSRPVGQWPQAPPAPVFESAALPPEGAAYPQILRGESYVWWRSMLGVDPIDGPGALQCFIAIGVMTLLLLFVLERKIRPVEVVS